MKCKIHQKFTPRVHQKKIFYLLRKFFSTESHSLTAASFFMINHHSISTLCASSKIPPDVLFRFFSSSFLVYFCLLAPHILHFATAAALFWRVKNVTSFFSSLLFLFHVTNLAIEEMEHYTIGYKLNGEWSNGCGMWEAINFIVWKSQLVSIKNFCVWGRR